MKLSLYGNMPIMTSRDPQVPMEAANKNYVDNAFITHSSNVSLHLTTAQNTLLDSLTVSATELNYLTGTTSSVQTQLNGKVAKAGDTMTGYLTLSANPTNTLHAATKGYVDTQDALKVSKTGDTLTGYLMLHADPTSTMHPATKQYVYSGLSTHAGNAALHLTSTQNTFLDGITVGFAEVNYLTGVTSAVQTQLNSKLNLSGGTLTGALTLSGDPTVALHAATKQYSDAQDALKVAKAGDTMTGALTLSGNPTVALHAAPKQYVDSAVSTHASDAALHLTSAQNTFLDAVTVTAAEVNYLSGVTSGVQAQLNTKFASAGGTITGDVTLAAGKGIFVPKAPTAANELVNKAYVDALVQGKEWKDPITDINLVADNLSAPPATPVVGDVYIIGAAPTGAWTGKAGFAAYHDGTAWVFLQARAVQAGDRFGVDLTSATTVSATLTAHVGKLVTIVSATPGAITYTADTQTPGATTLVFDPQSSKFGVSYTLTDELTWVPTNTSVNLTAGDGLTLAGNTLNFNYGAGLALSSDIIAVAPDTASGLGFDGTNKVTIKRDGTSLTASATGIRVAQTVLDDIANRVAKTGTSSVTGDVTFASTGTLKLDFTPTLANQAVNKGYVDAADTALQGQITTLNGTVTTLNADPVTKTYVNTQDALKVAKAGDTMSGFLTLHANPTAVLHAATKQYVDSTVSTHASDAALHLTVGQNAFLDAVTATATEVNRLVGVTGSVQTQIDSKVAKAGDTMTGLLTLSGDPTAAMHAATKQYSDAQDALKVAKAGDTMTGALTLSGDPTVALHAATKGYVDTNLSSHAINAALHLTAAQNTFLDAVTVTSTEVNYLTGVTSAVQTQLNSKLNLSGGTLTGALTLSGDPTVALHAATKQYSDAQDALKVAKAGDTMTGALTLSGNPTVALHAAPKQYVDSAVSTHASDAALHLTSAQNTFLDAVTVTAAEVNYLSGVTSGVQAQLNTKFASAGGTITGDVTLAAGKGIFVPKAPTAANELVNKAYVDALVQGKEWKDPITDINLVADNLSAPPATPVVGDVYIIGAAPTGAWTGKAGFAAYHDGTAWVFLQARAVQAGDRFGVDLTSATTVSATLTAHVGKLVTIVSATPGAITYTADTQTPGATTLVFDPQSSKFGVSYTLTDELTWVPTNTSVNLTAGDGLTLAGNTLNFNYGAGLALSSDIIAVAPDTASGLGFDGTNKVTIKRDGTSLTASATGIRVAQTVLDDIANRVAKTGTSSVTGDVTFASTGTLKLDFTPTLANQAVNKGYVDAADTALQGQITTLNGTVTTLNADPVTKTYVNTQDALKVAKAGDTMTGYLTLHANPTNNMHAVTKQYVDSVAQGLSAKPAVRVATIGNLAATYVNGTAGVGASLTGSVNGALVVDGVTVVTGDRILVKDQTNKLQNGDYTVQQTGTVSTPFILVRNTTVDQSNEVPGSFFYVFDGTLKGTGWTFTVDNPTTFTIGTNNIYVNQFSGQGSLVGGAGMILTGNTFNVQTANSSRIVVNADSIDLATTTVTPGTYTKLTVDGYGRATAGTNPNTLAGYGITDGQPLNANLTSLSSVATSGILVRDNTNTMVAKAIVTSGTGISVTNGSGGVSGDITISSNATAAATASTLVARDASGNFAANVITASLTGNASTATKLQTARTFAATGDVTAGAVSFDGSANVSLTTTLSNTGVVAGSYTKVTVDAKGRVTSGSNPTTLAGYGITDAYTKTETDALIAALRQEIAELHMYILSRI